MHCVFAFTDFHAFVSTVFLFSFVAKEPDAVLKV